MLQLIYRTLLLTTLVGAALAARAQHVPVPRLYQYNYHFYNPGYAGAEEDRELAVSFGTPNVTYKNPTLSSYGYYLGRVLKNVGAGTQVQYHQNNGYYRLDVAFTGNRSFQIGNFGRLAAGLQIGVKHLLVDYARVEELTGDTTLPQGKDTDFRSDASLGLWYNDRLFFAGASLMNLNSPTFEFKGSADFRDLRQLAITGGVRLGRDTGFDLTPSFLYTRQLSDTVQTLDLNATLILRRMLVLGATYRGFYEQRIPWVAMAGLQLGNSVQVVVSFDVPLDTPRQFYKFNAEGVVRVRF